jgi:hypothetical protein
MAKAVKVVDPTIEILKHVQKTNGRSMGALLPERAFVELLDMVYVTGKPSSVYLSENGATILREDKQPKPKGKYSSTPTKVWIK